MGDIIAARRRHVQASKSTRIERVEEHGHRVAESQRKPIESLFCECFLFFSVTP
ncbi:MAG: hypothetical protein V7641_1831 [Blastocatellia bacterium]